MKKIVAAFVEGFGKKELINVGFFFCVIALALLVAFFWPFERPANVYVIVSLVIPTCLFAFFSTKWRS